MRLPRKMTARTVWHVWWCLTFLLGFVLVRPAALPAASSVSAAAEAARADDVAAVSKLIKEHADVNAAANDGSTALLWAASPKPIRTAALN